MRRRRRGRSTGSGVRDAKDKLGLASDTAAAEACKGRRGFDRAQELLATGACGVRSNMQGCGRAAERWKQRVRRVHGEDGEHTVAGGIRRRDPLQLQGSQSQMSNGEQSSPAVR